MKAKPIMLRELAAESRHPSNYWIRVAGALTLLVLIAPMVLLSNGFSQGEGGVYFGKLNRLIFLAIWCVTPLLAADCISREKREGTLGLLFLTPLRAGGIVLAKVLVHGIRASALLVSAGPILALLLLMGGLSYMEVIRSFLVNSSALMCALSAGLLASSISRQRIRSMIGAASLSVLFLACFIQFHSICVGVGIGSLPAGLLMLTEPVIHWMQGTSGMSISGFPIASPGIGVSQRVALSAGIVLVFESAMLLFFVLCLAGRQVKRGWQEHGLSKRQEWLLKTFCTPLFWKRFFRQKMISSLDRNPIGWLQQYSWSARLTKWGWCLVAVWLQGSALAFAYSPSFVIAQTLFAFGVFSSMAFTAVNSFSRERQAGAMELILVTPLSTPQVINGRLFGIYAQFFPALMIWSSIWLLLPDLQARGPIFFIFVSTLVSTAVIGLQVSLRGMHFIVAWLTAAWKSLVLPMIASLIAMILFSPISSPEFRPGGVDLMFLFGGGFGGYRDQETIYAFSFFYVICQTILAAYAWSSMRQSLDNRTFAFK